MFQHTASFPAKADDLFARIIRNRVRKFTFNTACLIGGTVLLGISFCPGLGARADDPSSSFATWWSRFTGLSRAPLAAIVTVPPHLVDCATDKFGNGSCSVAAEAACQAQKYASGRPVETRAIAYGRTR
jgi:hypothetical protein